MKTVYRYSYLFLLILPFFLSHCGNKASEPTVVQTVTIADIWTGNVTDYDGDGYVSFFNLYFDLDINRGSKEAFVLLAIRFYDTADTTTYVELFSTESFTIEGSTDDDALYIDVELPSNIFPATGYDFLFLVLDSDDPEQRLAEMSATDQELLSNVPLEHIDDDLVVTIGNMWISDTVDTDLDGYHSSFHFNFDLNATGGTKDVFVMLATRLYDPGDTDPYYTYFTSADFTISGNEIDVKFINIDNSDATFPQGNYDFLFIVFDSSDPEIRLVEVSASTSSMLRNVSLEPTETDNSIWISGVWFKDKVDNDGDGYSSEATIVYEIDEENGIGADVAVDIAYKLAGAPTYTPLGTATFNVTGELNDARSLKVTAWNNYNHGSYDFKIDLRFNGYDNVIEDYENPVTDADLRGVNLELSTEDVPQDISVWNAWRSEVVDNDLDSYYSSVVITIDVDVSFGEADIYLLVYYKTSTTSTYTFLAETDPFHIIGFSSDDDQSYRFYNFPHDLWDIRFEVLFVGSSVAETIYDDTDDFDINDIPLETDAEDGLP